jgi:hypothetical protein
MGLKLFHFAHATTQFGGRRQLQLGCSFPYLIIRYNGFIPHSVSSLAKSHYLADFSTPSLVIFPNPVRLCIAG